MREFFFIFVLIFFAANAVEDEAAKPALTTPGNLEFSPPEGAAEGLDEGGTVTPEADAQKDVFADDLKKMIEPANIEIYYDQGKLINLQLAERKRDPTSAMLRSMLVPGWGQFYNDKPWKGFLAILSESTCIALTVYNYRLMQDFHARSRSAYNLYLKYEEGKDREKADYFKLRGNYDNGRYQYFIIETEKNGWLFAGFVFLSTLDAYIDAHLSDFDIYDLPRDPNPSASLSIPLFSASVSLW